MIGNDDDLMFIVCEVNIIKIFVFVLVGFVFCWFLILVMDMIDVVIGVFIFLC